MQDGAEIRFLRAKLHLLVEQVGAGSVSKNALALFTAQLDAWQRASAPSRRELLQFECQLDQALGMGLAPKARAQINDQLQKQFGQERIGQDALAVIEQILQCGRIANSTEVEVVTAFLANTRNRSVLGSERYERLGAMLDNFAG